MIKNQWYAVLESKEVKKEILSIKRLGEKMIFWRNSKNELSCFVDKCAHRGASFCYGEILGDHLQCPFHGLEYDERGKCKLIPANGKVSGIPDNFYLSTYPVSEKFGFIWIFWGDQKENLPEIPFFTDIDDSFIYTTIQDHWDIHYTRCIENQLDVSHLPFVHRTTIGAGNRTIVDGPVLKWDGFNSFYVYAYSRKDDGSKPLKATEIPDDPARSFWLQFIFPHIWQNHITKNIRIVVSFVPVDENNTVLYLRFYQNILRLPLLGKLFCKMAMPYNRIILHQDRRIVLTQQPRISGMKIGENLFPADSPIVAYRKRREELQGN